MEPVSNEVKEAVELLDKLVSTENAWVRVYEEADDSTESSMEGTRAGYLRLGIQILKGAIADANSKNESLPIDVYPLFTEDSTTQFSFFRMSKPGTEPQLPQPASKTLGDRLALIGCALLAIVVVLGFANGIAVLTHSFKSFVR